MKKYRINLNGKTYEVEVEEMKEGEEIKPAQPKHQAAPKVLQKSQPVSNAGQGQDVSAPMPGTIVGIKVKEGDTVKAGQVLVILEAMKMENEIIAPKDGKVMQVKVSQGANVGAGEGLILIG